ncbi:hypothetical protein B7P43_G00518 [Cryptotermes secundus]|uniref:Mos1 transposase HTH domain-containing protein n=1 Tax=Cryptotermes secundus TaxID=105785 RepID=A0A2J7R670_9NEOP|nr:hypothetical protein B7P43_G00518 [Cryptotermes secundus]
MATFSLQEQRVIIRFLQLRGGTPIEIHRQLSETCGDGVMSVKNVRSWVRQFKEGRTSCDNEPKQSRHCTSRSDNMVERVEKVVLEDRQLSVENIASKVGISVGSVHTILHEDLRMRKVSSRWVPRMLADDHKAARMAICQAILTGHREYAMQQFLRENSLEVVSHAPFSPDLAPSVFWLFPTMKDTLCSRTFTSRAAIASAIFQWSKQTPTEVFAAAMESWRRRCEKCVRLQGDYVEK